MTTTTTSTRILPAALALLLLAVALAPLAQARPVQNAAGEPPAAETADTDEPDAQDSERFQALRSRYMRLVNSLKAIGSIEQQERAFITRMMDEIAAFRADHPGNDQALAMETQLAIMLEDHDRVFGLFDQLMQRNPDNAQLAQDWLGYFQDAGLDDRVDAIIDRLVQLGPENQAIRRVVAEHLRASQQYARAIDFLEQVELDAENNPRAIVLLSDCLFAEHEFQRSLELLQGIPESVLQQNQPIKRQVTGKLPDRQQYIELWQREQELRSEEAAANDLPRAEILIADHGRVVVELFENQAPNTVANFITLAEDDFYAGTTFHRVLQNFMAQGGDIYSKTGEGEPGTGNPGYYIPDEHQRDDARKHFSGSLAMAKTAAPNTAGSQFYLTFEPTPWLNGKHTVFGRVIEGLDVVRSIEQGDVIEAVNVLRTRDHEYTVETIPAPDPEADAQDETEDPDAAADNGATDAADGSADDQAGDDAPPQQ